MTITIGTGNFIGLLTDALQTAETDSDELSVGVHIATHRSGFGDEPGNVDLIALTSTDRFVVGHTFDVVSGQIVASVWPVDAVQTVLAICKNLWKVRGKEHTVDVEVVEQVPDGKSAGEDEPSHPGYLVTVSETPALFDTDTEFQFHAEHPARFPLDVVRKALNPQPGDDAVDATETWWSARVLAPLTAIARRRKSTMNFYRTSGRHGQVVQIGGTWLGCAMPAKPVPGEERTEPSIDPLLSVSVSAAADLLRNGSGLLVSGSVEE